MRGIDAVTRRAATVVRGERRVGEATPLHPRKTSFSSRYCPPGFPYQTHSETIDSESFLRYAACSTILFQINGEKIGKNKVKILRDGNEIAFGTALSQHHLNGGLEDYRESPPPIPHPHSRCLRHKYTL